MAVTRLGHIKEDKKGKNPHQGIRNCINYIFNPKKTENFKYVGGNNVILRSYNRIEDSYQQFMATKDMFGKKLGRQAYHYKLSFATEDNVSPELAMEITKEFCERYLGQYESVYSVHTNTKHIHSHIVFNSVNMVTGYKYYYKNGDWRKYIQPIVNDICLKYKLSYIDLNPSEDLKLSNKKKYKTYGQWLQDSSDITKKKVTKKPYYSYSKISKDIDETTHVASSFKEFEKLMEKRGYKVFVGKHISVLAPGRERVVRTYQLTSDKNTYTKENIYKMIAGTYSPIERQEVLAKLTEDFKVFLSTSRIDIKTTRKKNNLEFAQAEEAVRMVYKKGFSSIDDVKSYLSYINQADKELNIIKKQANTSIYKYLEYSDKMEELMSYIPKLYEYYINGNNKDAYIRAKELYSQLSSNGVSPVKLYKSKKEAEELIGYIDKFKKKLFVDKIVCNRIISSNTIEYVMQIQKKRNEK